MQCMVASSIPCKLSLCADRAHARAGDSHTSSGIDVACPTTQNVLAIASPHELQGDSWPSSPTGTSSFCCNQQYSITAVTTSTGTIAEQYAYSAYGQPTILDASASVLSSSAINNRYTYTGREWDATLALHHFRARWVSGLTGRFLSRDPITYRGGINLYEYVSSNPLWYVDPYGHLEKPPIPAPSPGVVGGVCRVVTRRVMLPVTVLVLSYKCGTKVAEYTTIPIAVIVTEWVCSDPNPNPGPNPSPDPPSQPPVNPPQPPRDPNARCWCCDLQTYPSDGSPGGTKNCRPERAAECWAGYPFSMCCHPSTPATPAINPCAEDPRFPFKDKDKWVEDFYR
jgi:RHS repeat-associated protein